MTGTATISRSTWPQTVGAIARVALGIIFLATGTQKIIQPHEFLAAVAGYEMLKPPVILFVAVVLPGIELALGILLVSGAFVPGALLLASLMLTVFSGALSVALIRHLSIDCGCFAITNKPSSLSVWSLLRTIAINLAAIWLYDQNLGWVAADRIWKKIEKFFFGNELVKRPKKSL